MGERRIKTFEDLEVWQFCRNLCNELTKVARRLPNDEKYKLKDQIIRAARSVTNNIAEGYGRYHYPENIQFCRQSRGSLYESIDHLIICFDNSYLSKDEVDELKAKCSRGIQILNGYI